MLVSSVFCMCYNIFVVRNAGDFRTEPLFTVKKLAANENLAIV